MKSVVYSIGFQPRAPASRPAGSISLPQAAATFKKRIWVAEMPPTDLNLIATQHPRVKLSR
jgi:hypothetical protein